VIASDTLLIIPGIQPLNSHASKYESYDIHWNPIWEPSNKDFPLTPCVSVPMSSSDIDEMNPVTSEESFIASGEMSN